MIQKTAIIGMGALGMLYADKIAENIGEDAVEFVMDSRRVEKYRDAVFTEMCIRDSVESVISACKSGKL